MTQSDRTWKLRLAVSSILFFTFGNPVFAQSQIVPDNTLGTESSQVTPNANGLPVEQIGGGAQRGANLFHSFQEFNVSEGRGAYFVNPAGVENVISRVTGANPSAILGTLGVLGNANLFLINPNGIIFGPNASLNVSGSFVASTADSLSFADGTQFSATNPQNEPLLTVSVPTGLQFGANPGTILVQGKLIQNPPELPSLKDINRASADFPSAIISALIERVQQEFQQIVNRDRINGLQVLPGKTLAFVGGDVRLEGGILGVGGIPTLPGGRIELGSVADSGQVSLTQTSNGFALGYENVSSFGNIDLSQQSLLDVSGTNSGNVILYGNNVTIKDNSVIIGTTLGNGEGEEIFVRSQHLNVSGNSIIGAFAPIAGTSGDITLEVGNAIVQNAIIGSFSDGNADTGDLTLRATDTVQLTGTIFNGQLPGGILVITGGSGESGNATIQTRQLTTNDGAQIAIATGETAQGGTAPIDASNIRLSGQSTDAEEGQGGTVLINASDIRLSGQSTDFLFPSGIFAPGFSARRAGNINIYTQRLTLQDGAVISASTREGEGGNVVANASDFIQIVGTSANPVFSSYISAGTLGAQAAGNVEITTGQLIIRDGGRVTAAALGEFGTVGAGNITINARTISLDNQGQITAETQTGDSGNIQLQSQFLLLRRDSQINTNAQGAATGGNINIDTQFLIAVPNENSNITANAVRGQGGNININAPGVFGIEFRGDDTLLSDITASSRFGLEGNVNINTARLDPNRALVNLPTQPVETEVVQACQPSADRASSEFIVTGRGGLPPSPQEALGTNATGIDWVTIAPDAAQAPENTEARENIQSPDRIVEAQGWVVGADGKLTLVAQTPQSPWFLPSSCKIS